jgi:glycerophosphoryl diester phosphodiesterase
MAFLIEEKTVKRAGYVLSCGAAVIALVAAVPAVPAGAVGVGPQGIAHRGDQRFDEETEDALRSAISLGLCNEVDVHLTKDNVPVLNHDPTVDRTLSGTGRVHDLTSTQFLAMTTAGGRHPITLATAIDITRSSGGCLVAEVWPGFWSASRYAAMGSLVTADDQIWFDSQDRTVLAAMNAASPTFKLAWKTRAQKYTVAQLPTYISVVIADKSSAELVAAHHAIGVQVWRERANQASWNLNALKKQGVDKIYTNDVPTFAAHVWP